MTALVASLGMYDTPWIAVANDALWAGLARRLRDTGIEAPATLDRTRPLDAIWRDPALVFGQTCGWPLTTALRGLVEVVATPTYSWPGCDGPWHRSWIVGASRLAGRHLAELRGLRFAFNSVDSNTGYQLPRATFAPLADGGTFFAEMVETGTHLASLAAVREGRADVAAIDCVTHGLAAAHRPDLLEGTVVLGETEATPGLPFVISAALAPRSIEDVRRAVQAAIFDPALVDATRMLGMTGAVELRAAIYDIALRSSPYNGGTAPPSALQVSSS